MRRTRDAAIVRLPVAQLDVALRFPVGADDVLLLEAGRPDLGMALALLARIADDRDGAPLDPATLPVGDIDVLLLRLRQRILGDVVNAEARCPTCQARVDITFSIAAYVAHHRAEVLAGVVPVGDDGWYRLEDADVEFRIPRAADQLAIAHAPDPEAALQERCVRPPDVAGATRDRVEATMEAMAPSLYGELEGTCPGCGAPVTARFDPVQYTLRELREQAAYVYDDVCAIAHRFHWSEAEILALPGVRRARYAELAAEHARRDRTSS
jgi:hypothetical protein